MWNESSEGWLGDSQIRTKESIIKEIELSRHLHHFLALSGDKVVGYCGLTKLRTEDDTLYIDLLNVIPAYHGQKIGKLLLKHAMKYVVIAKYPRLDLHTWSGNLKAVPLYKKCGFFWENDPTSVRLMSFISLVLMDELLCHYLGEMDWYDDSSRAIEVVPDGRKENKFEYYTYSWQKDANSLTAEFCRRGRGLRMIDCADFKITEKVENLSLIFGAKYKISYNIINKSDKPLYIELQGLDDKNICFDLARELCVDSEQTITAEFFVDSIDKAQEKGKWHPCVKTKIVVNGLTSELNVGVEPCFPAIPKLDSVSRYARLGSWHSLSLNVKNYLAYPASFEIEIPKAEGLHLEEYCVKTQEILPNNSASIFIKARIDSAFFFDKNIKLTYTDASGKKLSFIKKTYFYMNCEDSSYFGKHEKVYMAGIGQFTFSLDFHANYNVQFYSSIANSWIQFSPPQLGMPYTCEFDTKAPSNVEHHLTPSGMDIICTYQSDKTPHLGAQVIYSITAGGIIRQRTLVTSSQDIDNVCLSNPVCLNAHLLKLPYDGKIMEVGQESADAWSMANYDTSKIHENWLYCQAKVNSCGLIFSDDTSLHFPSWFLTLEKNLGAIKAGETITTKANVAYLDCFDSVGAFRKFVTGNLRYDTPHTSTLDAYVNDGNPFVKDKFTVNYHEYINESRKGKITVTSKNELFNKTEMLITEYKTSQEINIDLSSTAPNDIISIKSEFGGSAMNKKRVIFPIDNSTVLVTSSVKEEKEVLTASNGIIKLAAADKYAPCLFSMQAAGYEWLDSSFPTPSAKSWWKPWAGGAQYILKNRSLTTLLEEKNEMREAELTDTKGNIWRGICMRTDFKKHEDFKGLSFEQYYLLMPGVPVVAVVTKIINSTDVTYPYYFLKANTYINNGEKDACYAHVTSDKGEALSLYVDNTDKYINTKEVIRFSHADTPTSMYVVSDTERFRVGIDTEILFHGITHWCPVPARGSAFIIPYFYAFAPEQDLQKINFADLLKIRF